MDDTAEDASSWPDNEPVISDGVVTLRFWEERDVPSLVEASADAEAATGTTLPHPLAEDEARAIVTACRDLYAARRAVALAVVDAVAGSLQGSIRLAIERDDLARARISYWIAAPSRRQAVATEAVTLLTRWAFVQLGLERIELLADVDDAATRKVAARSGFKKEGVLRSYRVVGDRRTDTAIHALVLGDLAPAKS